MNNTTICPNCFEIIEKKAVCPHCGYIENGDTETSYALPSGTSLSKDRYLIGKVLGIGGFGITYKAFDTKLNIVVAVKEYYPAQLVSRVPQTRNVMIVSGERRRLYLGGLQRFLTEAQNMAAFSDYPDIVHVQDYFEENNTAYIVMEFLDGLNLSQYLELNNGKIDCDEMLDIFGCIMNALEALHKKNIIHRDVSPSNIYITVGNKVKLIDFGAARFASKDEENEKTQSVVVKVGFTPPEQYASKGKQGFYTDIYALGASMYRAITGIVPEESPDRQNNDTMLSPKDLGVDVPDNVNTAIMRAMAVKSSLRFQSIKEFRDALLGNKKVNSVESEIKRRRTIRSTVAAIFIGLICIGVYFFQQVAETELTAPADSKINIIVPMESVNDEALGDGDEAEVDETISDDKYVAAIRNVVSDFKNNEQFADKNYNVNLIEADSTNYMSVLNESKESGITTIYRADYADEKDNSEWNRLIDSWTILGFYRGETILGDEYNSGLLDKHQIPTMFDIPVAFVNITLADKYSVPTDNIDSTDDLLNATDYQTSTDNEELIGLAIAEDCIPYLIATLGGYTDGKLNSLGESMTQILNEYAVSFEKARELLRDEKVIVLVSFVSNNSEIRELQYIITDDEGEHIEYIGAYCEPVPICKDDFAIYGKYIDSWAFIPGNGEDELCSVFMNYFLDYSAQNIMCVQGGWGLPVNKTSLEQYCTETNDSLKFITENLNRVVLTEVE